MISIEELETLPRFVRIVRKRDRLAEGGQFGCGTKRVYSSYDAAHRDGRHFNWASYRCLACCKRLRRDAWHNGNN